MGGIDLIGAAIGGLIDAAEKKKQGQIAEFQAQAAGAGQLGANQAAALQGLMSAYGGVF